MSGLRRAGASVGALALTGSLLAALPTTAAAAEDPSTFASQRIALGGDGVFPNYRIPAIIQLDNGDLLASYDGRPTGWDAPGPNSILQRRSTDNGRTWQGQTVIAAGRDGEDKIGYSDPSYVYDRETGTLFNFHVFSKDTGFWNSVDGDDDEDRQVMSASVSVSTDDGHTWTKRSVTEIVKPPGVRATFASSGHGIQLQRGEHAGRLVLQYAGSMTDGTVRSYSVYSDDHGETWHMGKPTGTNMDENKVVELSDGTLMLNSRMHTNGVWRYVATSTDGGETWSEPELDHTLVDPRNNASIIAMNPDAEAGSAEAKELLFSNANSAAGRQNGSVRYSCDDGQTWPVVKTYEPGATSYSDLVAVQDGTFGVLYETTNNEIRYGQFGEEWLAPFCANFTTTSATLGTGETATLTITVRNDDEATLPAGTASADLPSGWSATRVDTPEIAPGASAEIALEVTAPANARIGVNRGDVVIEAGEWRVRGDVEITVNQRAGDNVFLSTTNAEQADRAFALDGVPAGAEVFSGDWDGDGVDTLGWREGNLYTFAESNVDGGGGFVTMRYGRAADEVLVGDWDGDGSDTIGVRRGSTILLRDDLAGGVATTSYAYGRVDDDAIAGDWDGDGADSVAVRRGNLVLLSNALESGAAEQEVRFGRASDTLLAGNLNREAGDELAVRRGNTFYVQSSLTDQVAARALELGRADDLPLLGDWDDDGSDTIGVFRP